MKALIIGYGEIGKAVFSYIRFNAPDIDLETFDINNMDKKLKGEFDLLLICFPFNEQFDSEVKKYQDIFLPKGIIIFSTVAIGTTEKIENAVHCPVEGVHPKLEESMMHWHWFVGGRTNEYIIEFFHSFNNPVTFILNPRTTELAKLQSTTNYGLMIEYARYINNICKKEDIDYSYMCQYNMAYNRLYHDMAMFGIKRYILKPPEGEIGGHCIIPNAKILNEQYESPLLERIINGHKVKEA